MTEKPLNQLNVDPWTASSLLQKAIRRGEVELAQKAAATFFSHRGTGIWRRLAIIAVEDVGIGDVELVAEVARLATDNTLRGVLGSDTELINDLCFRLGKAAKDRSADYLYSAATLLEAAQLERTSLRTLREEEQLSIAADENSPIVRRATAALLACTSLKNAMPRVVESQVETFLSRLSVRSASLEDAVVRLSRVAAHPFSLMLPLIWCRWWHDGASCAVVSDEIPVPEFVGEIPLYAFDKHTAVGKQAIASFARHCSEVRAVLASHVAQHRHEEAAYMAAFYADAVPVARKLHWAPGSLMTELGRNADLLSVGVPSSISPALVKCMGDNLDELNKFRRARFGAARTSG